LINNNIRVISHRFRVTAAYSWKVFIKNCGQTAAGWDMVTIDSL